MIRRTFYRTFEGGLHLRNRMRGIGVHRDPWKHFGVDGVPEAISCCDRINRDFPAFLRPPADPPATGVEHRSLRRPPARGVAAEELCFDSPRPSGIPANDRVRIRLWRPQGNAPGDRVVLFHHPVYQSEWRAWEWFLRDLYVRVPVAFLVAPYHYERTPPGWFPGEGIINPNPVRIYEAIRQWIADQKLAHRLLERELGLRPVAVIGFSLGAFQSLLAASIGELHVPIVSLASTNRYAFGLKHGTLGGPILDAMRRVGVTEALLFRMADSLQLERFVAGLRDHPVLIVRGLYDRVDPPPSGERLERALRPMRSLHVAAGHATLLFARRRILREIRSFFDELGLLRETAPGAVRAVGRLETERATD